MDDPVLAMVCEPVERANSNHLFTAGLADSMGVRYNLFNDSSVFDLNVSNYNLSSGKSQCECIAW